MNVTSSQPKESEKCGTDQHSIALLRAALNGSCLPPNRHGVAGVPQKGIHSHIKSPNTATPFQFNDLSTHCTMTGSHTPNLIVSQQGFNLAAVTKRKFRE